ncbi:MAG TPA: methyltransferase domain-containing protein [Smithellaceae bacterium]|nr:methyltransferase domain-containing protein [Smithellaceae bacterium]
MVSGKHSIRWRWVVWVAVIVLALFAWENRALNIETDILESMPHDDPVLADARLIISHLPVQDRIIVDLEWASTDRTAVARAASFVEERLRQSGLFSTVGMNDAAEDFPDLIAHVADSLPILFSPADLEEKIEPLLTDEKISAHLALVRAGLGQLEGLGSASRIAKDPLDFSAIVLKPLASLVPSEGAQFHRGHLLSADGRHALVIAHIDGSGTDTVRAAAISDTILQIEKDLRAHPDFAGGFQGLAAAGAYRAALDNETAAKRDTRVAIVLTTLSIAFLLLVTFPRPLLGLLALIPSTVGALGALFICSFLFDSISILAVGFGGAILAFTVDLGLTYLLFLDRTQRTYGPQVARELWSAERLSALTTLGAFALLLISDFKILAQIGVFAALGALLALLFVHFIFPKIFPEMPPAKRASNQWLVRAIERIAAPAWWKVALALIFGLSMLVLAKPVFNVDLQAMNSLRPETLAAEQKIQSVWGDLSGKCYLYIEAPDMQSLQNKNDLVLPMLREDLRRGKLADAFLPGMLFPSEETAGRNYDAWRGFWTPDRIAGLKTRLDRAAAEYGFTPDAFAPFWASLEAPYPQAAAIPAKHFELLGITQTASGLVQLNLLSTGAHYDASEFFNRLARNGQAKLFDADLFNRKMSEFLQSLFLEIALIVSVGIVLVVFLFFLEWRLSLAVLAPIVFALVATLGTLKLIGHPLDIPGIMLWIVIMGMGIDYAIYYVCTYQRHPDTGAWQMQTVRLSVFLAAATTFVGFGVLALAQHPLLRSIGVVSLLGIAYSLLGTYLILPATMEKIFSPGDPSVCPPAENFRKRIRAALSRYRLLPGYPRVFARLKIRIDPMFRELDRFIGAPRRVMDIGCGFGVPAAWLLAKHPRAQFFGLEPDEERVWIARRVIGANGSVQAGRAPDLPDVAGPVDTVLMLDMLHLISNDEFQLALSRINEKLEPGGMLLVRATVPSARRMPWKRWVESARVALAGLTHRFRSEEEIAGLMRAAGLNVKVASSSVAGVEEKWFVGTKP